MDSVPNASPAPRTVAGLTDDEIIDAIARRFGVIGFDDTDGDEAARSLEDVRAAIERGDVKLTLDDVLEIGPRIRADAVAGRSSQWEGVREHFLARAAEAGEPARATSGEG